MEKFGSGIRRIIETFRKAGLPEPLFQNMSGGFMVTVHDQVMAEKTAEAILELIASNPKITIRKISEELNLSRRGIEWQLASLKEKGILQRIGPDRDGHW